MYTYPVDLEPEQIVRWVMAEREAAPNTFRIAVRQTVETREIPIRREIHLGDEDFEDLSEVAVDVTLEITSARGDDGWLLRIVVEDEAGPRLGYRESALPNDQEIDVRSFYRQFIQRGRGTATVVAEIDDTAAERRFRRLLDDITVNRHAGDGKAQRA
jgi:prophage tail gpP-like protein